MAILPSGSEVSVIHQYQIAFVQVGSGVNELPKVSFRSRVQFVAFLNRFVPQVGQAALVGRERSPRKLRFFI